MSLQARAHRLFTQAHMQWGGPTITVVRPITQWNLPAGYSLDTATGNIRDGAGAVLADPTQYIATAEVDIVPAAQSHNGSGIMPADTTPTDEVQVRIRYSDLAAVRAAQWIEYAGEKYDVVDDARTALDVAGVNGLPPTITLHRRRDDKRASWSQWDRRWAGQ